MSRLYATILLLVLTMQPAIKIGNVLYYQLNIDYIVEKYCVNKARPQLKCNGKCYLNKKLQLQQGSTETSEKTILITEAFLPLYFQQQDIQLSQPLYFDITSSKFWKNNTIYLYDINKKIDPPPKTLS
ncbi:hypothetical protein [Aquimarina rhabdastrellae]